MFRPTGPYARSGWRCAQWRARSTTCSGESGFVPSARERLALITTLDNQADGPQDLIDSVAEK